MFKNSNFKTFISKSIVLVAGLFILAFGIAISTRCGLGVSPSASLAYVLSQIFPYSMGTFTTIINIVFVFVQICLFRKDYKIVNLLQLVVVFIFGYFTDLTLLMTENLEISSYPMQVICCILACIIMGLGVFLEVKANLIVMASEGAISAIASKSNKDFGTIKIFMDWGFILLSTVIGLSYFHKLVGVREGTIIAAFLVGFFVRIYNRKIPFFDRFVSTRQERFSKCADNVLTEYPLVITIERELGSGGHEIGERLAKELGIKFYDYAIIEETAATTGLPADDILDGEERFKSSLLSYMYENSYATSGMHSKAEGIFNAQSQVIRDIASRENCVIVGRLGSYILKGRPNTMNLFFSADDDFRAKRLAERRNIPMDKALPLLKQEDRMRINYCSHFTGMPWGLAKHYDMTLHTSDYGIDESTKLVILALKAAYELEAEKKLSEA